MDAGVQRVGPSLAGCLGNWIRSEGARTHTAAQMGMPMLQMEAWWATPHQRVCLILNK